VDARFVSLCGGDLARSGREAQKKDRIYDAARLKKRIARVQPIIKGENRKWESTREQAS
jgi:hypothetical protein